MGLLVRLCVVAALIAAGGCYHYDPLWCLEDRDCADAPEGRRFCDLEGTYPASEGIARTCIAAPGGVTVSAPPGPIDLVRGRTAEVALAVTRGSGLEGPVAVRMIEATPGLTAEPVTIPADAASGVLVVRADPTASSYGFAEAKLAAAIGDHAASDIVVRFDVVGVPGTIDPTFGTEGTVFLERIADPLTSVRAVLLQEDRIVVAGTRGLAGLRHDGSVDTRFGATGRVDLMSSVTSDLVAIGSAADGRILVASHVNANGIRVDVAKYTRDGLFSSGFQVSNVQSSLPSPGSIIATPTDEVVLYAQDGVAAIWKLDAVGTPVPRFGDAGRMSLLTRNTGTFDVLLLRDDGALIVAQDDRLRRISVEGDIDMSYGVGGALALPTPGGLAPELRRGVATGSGLVVIGVTGSNREIPIMWRLQATGDLDTSFATGGYVSFTPASGEKLEIRDVVATDDGVVYAAFHHQDAASSPKLMLMRIDPQGKLDPTYADAGRTTDDGGPWTPNRAALLPRHKFLVAGHDVDRQRVIVRRYWY